MAEFRIKIAGRVVAVSSLFDSTRDYCRNYLTLEEPDFSVSVTAEDLIFEQAVLDAEARREGLRLRLFTDPFLERTSIQRKAAQELLSWNTLLLHGSAVAVDGQGYLFMAKCGTGKSTHTRLWRQVFGQRAVMVNDDKPFIRLTASGAVLCGAPWSGKHGLDTNVEVPLRGICILERGAENRIRSITAAEALPMLLHEGGVPDRKELVPKYEALVHSLAGCTRFWRMECNKLPQAAQLSHTAMSGIERKEEKKKWIQ